MGGMLTDARLQDMFPLIVENTGPKCNAAILFLHGSGDSGDEAFRCVNLAFKREFNFPHARILYPTAPRRSYTLLNGGLSNVWFDRLELSPDVPEQRESIEGMCESLSSLVQEQVEKGIPKSRIIIGMRCKGGFSMGGAMALHLAYRYHRDVAGVFGLSCFLNKDSAVLQALRSKPEVSAPPVFICHGDNDDLVLPAWGRETYKYLSSLGAQATFHTFPFDHNVNTEELEKLKEWIYLRIPDD